MRTYRINDKARLEMGEGDQGVMFVHLIQERKWGGHDCTEIPLFKDIGDGYTERVEEDINRSNIIAKLMDTLPNIRIGDICEATNWVCDEFYRGGKKESVIDKFTLSKGATLEIDKNDHLWLVVKQSRLYKEERRKPLLIHSYTGPMGEFRHNLEEMLRFHLTYEPWTNLHNAVNWACGKLYGEGKEKDVIIEYDKEKKAMGHMGHGKDLTVTKELLETFRISVCEEAVQKWEGKPLNMFSLAEAIENGNYDEHVWLDGAYGNWRGRGSLFGNHGDSIDFRINALRAASGQILVNLVEKARELKEKAEVWPVEVEISTEDKHRRGVTWFKEWSGNECGFSWVPPVIELEMCDKRPDKAQAEKEAKKIHGYRDNAVVKYYPLPTVKELRKQVKHQWAEICESNALAIIEAIKNSTVTLKE